MPLKRDWVKVYNLLFNKTNNASLPTSSTKDQIREEIARLLKPIKHSAPKPPTTKSQPKQSTQQNATRQSSHRSSDITYDVRDGVMRYAEIRPRTVEENPRILDQYAGYYVSQKYDGWQAVWDGNGAFTTKTGKRTFRPPPKFANLLPKHVAIAGELIIPGKQATSVAGLIDEGGVAGLNRANNPDWDTAQFMAFDLPGSKAKFSVRTEQLEKIVNKQCARIAKCPMVYVKQTQAKDYNHIYRMFKKITSNGGEGVVLTHPDSLYVPSKKSKQRLKLKGREDSEAKIIDFNYSEANVMKSLKVEEIYKGKKVQFTIGTGFSHEEKNNPRKYFKKGDMVKYSYRDRHDSGKPKEARFLEKRHVADM